MVHTSKFCFMVRVFLSLRYYLANHMINIIDLNLFL